MTPADLIYARGQLGLSAAQLAAELGYGRTSVWRWESGELPIPRVVELAVNYLLVKDAQTDTEISEKRIRIHGVTLHERGGRA